MYRPQLRYPVAALAGLLGLAALVLAPGAPLAGLDLAVSQRLRAFGLANPAWVEALRLVTTLGDTAWFVAVGAVLAVWLLLRRGYAPAAATALVTVTVPVLWVLAHLWLPRPRPVDGFVHVAGNGFPSGHASHASAAALFAVLLLWPRLRWPGRAAAAVTALVLAGLVGLSRVALLAHWPTDVLGSWLLGAGVVLLCVRAGSAVESRAVESRAAESRAARQPGTFRRVVAAGRSAERGLGRGQAGVEAPGGGQAGGGRRGEPVVDGEEEGLRAPAGGAGTDAEVQVRAG